MALEWFVQTFDPMAGRFLPEFETWHDRDEAEAREEFLKDRRIPQFCERRLMSYGTRDGKIFPEPMMVESRIIERFLPGPVAIHGSVMRYLRQWSHRDGCKVSFQLLDPTRYTTNERADKIAFEDGMMTYLPKGKQHVEDDQGNWQPDNRISVKPGKGVRTILTAEAQENLTDADIEQFANRVKSIKVFQSGVIQIVRGEDMRDWYRNKNSVDVRSCMGYDNVQHLLDFYVDNPETVGLAIMLDNDGMLKGRALIWNLDDGRVFMDRIYTGTDSVRTAFIAWANDNGMVHKMRQDARSQTMIVIDGREYPDSVLFATTKKKYQPTDLFPYLDTMRYINIPTGRLTNNPSYRHTHISDYQDGQLKVAKTKYFPADGDPPPRLDPWGNEIGPDDPMPTHRCAECYRTFVEGTPGFSVKEFTIRNGRTTWYCESCRFDGWAKTCRMCGEEKASDWFGVEYDQPRGVCLSCMHEGKRQCSLCQGWKHEWGFVDVRIYGPDADTIQCCADCYEGTRECSTGHRARWSDFPTLHLQSGMMAAPFCWRCWDNTRNNGVEDIRAWAIEQGLTEQQYDEWIEDEPVEVDEEEEDEDYWGEDDDDDEE